MIVRVIYEVELDEKTVRKFQRFFNAQNDWMNTGDERSGKIAEKLKSFVDNRWDEYMAWKRAKGYLW